MNINELKVDEDFKNLLPPLTDEAFEKLEKDILVRGVLDPILLWNGYVTDGHNRLEICKKHGIRDVEVKNLPLLAKKSDVMQWIIDHQLGKRNLTKSQLVKSNDLVKQQIAKEAKERQAEYHGNQYENALGSNLNEVQKEPIRTAAKIAEKAGVSENTYRDMELITFKGTPEQIERMDKGGKGNSVSAIAKEVKADIASKEEKKLCSSCQRMLPISQFFKNKRYADGKNGLCRDCERERKRKISAVSVDRTGSILKAIEDVKDMTNIPVETFDDVLDVMKSITDSFVQSFNYNYKKIVFDTEEKKQEIDALISGIAPRLGKGMN